MDNRNTNNDHNFYGSDPQSQSTNGAYEYVFSSGNAYIQPSHPPRKDKNGKWIAVAFLTVVLSVSLSFMAGFAGTYFANLTNGASVNAPAPAPSADELYNEDPSSILNKSESSISPYGSAGDEVFSVSQVVQRVQDSVVVINASISAGNSIFGGAQTSNSSGSGVIISEDGYILTCHHVVENAVSVTVTLNSGKSYMATLVGSDENSDLAVIRIKAENGEKFVYAEQGCSADLVVGERVVAIGNPLGTLGGTVTDGIISATERSIQTSDSVTMTLLQTNAAINSGNSGGGLFNLDGKLIGIVNAKYASAGVEGLAFAIPIDSAYTVQLDLIQYGYVRGIVDHGLDTIDITQSNISYYSYYHKIYTIGVYVRTSELSNRIQNKDRIVSVNGVAVNTTADLNRLIDQYKVGDTVTFIVERDGEKITVDLTLKEYIPESARTEN